MLFLVLISAFLSVACTWCLGAEWVEMGNVQCVRYSSDGSKVATTTPTHVSVWDTQSKQLLFRKVVNNCGCIAFAPDGVHLAVSDTNSNIQILDMSSSYSLISSWNAALGAGVLDMQYSSDSQQLLLCGGSNGWAKLYTISTTSTVYSLNAKSVSCALLSSNFVVVARWDNKIRTYDASGSQIFSHNINNCLDLDVSTDELRILAACDDGGDKGIVVHSGGSQVVIVNAGDTLGVARYSLNDRHMMVGGDEGIVYLINGTSFNYTTISQFRTSSAIIDGDFYADEYLVVGTQDGSLYQYRQVCKHCQAGYFLNPTSRECDLCWDSLQGCGLCSSPTYCLQCVAGYIINTTSNTCDLCLRSMEGCGTCYSDSFCEVCLPGFYLDSGGCSTCRSSLVGCLSCNSSSYCLECQADYYENSGTCQLCAMLSYCVKCLNSTYCSQCIIGFYEDSGVCQPCASNCLACQSPTNCTDCRVGYYASETLNCVQCSADCLACNNTYCFHCVNHMYASGGSCVNCAYPCATCNSTHCSSCVIGYYYDTDQCHECKYPCSSCTDDLTCLSCSSGLFLWNDSCQECNKQFPHCVVCDVGGCEECSVGYYVDSGLCHSCYVMHGCVLCNSSSLCFGCGSGYYLGAGVGNSSCQSCSVGCSTCISSTNCTNCFVGYYLDTATDTCQRCVYPCSSCSSETDCLECDIGFYLTGTLCTLCQLSIPSCLSCYHDSSSLICLSCGLGMLVVNDICEQCPNNCTVCNDSNVCTSCTVGFYLDNDICQPCHHNCIECTSDIVCISCIVGYYLDSGECLPCSAHNCLSCNSSSYCFSCSMGHYVDASNQCGLCLDVMDNCLICSSDVLCIECNYGYWLLAPGVCDSCAKIEGCKHCNSAVQCINCEIGYYLDSNICVKCDDGCKECSDTASCSFCLAGYTQIGGLCPECSSLLQGCQLCSDSSTCTYCSSAYFLNSASECELCVSSLWGCAYCNTSSICTHCYDGLYLQADECELCGDAISGCILCNSSSECLSCQFGYYLDGGGCSLCSVMVEGCVGCDGLLSCDECQGGYYLSGGVCEMCVQALIGCMFCHSDTVCVQCHGGYYLDSGSNECEVCAVDGCQVCTEGDTCLSCNTKYYLTTALACEKCSDVLDGCVECSSDSVCSECDIGYYRNTSNACQLCSAQMLGCGVCSSSSVCLQCKSGYYINSANQCQLCQAPLLGCLHCINASVCEQCEIGYWLDGSGCEKCTVLEGCFACINGSYCQKCSPSYFNHDNVCYSCEVLTGCYICSSNVSCSVCKGGYVLNDEQLCQPMRVEAYDEVTQLKFSSAYFNESALQHILYAKTHKYNISASPNWTDTTKLILQDPQYEQTKLEIQSGQFSEDQSQLLFVTNNPLPKDLDWKPMPFVKKRLLTDGSLGWGYRVKIEMQQPTVNEILPTYYSPTNLVIQYSLDDAQFTNSYLHSITYPSFYKIFGIILTVTLFINFLIKGLCTVPSSYEMGQIVPHVLAMKMPALLMHPMYVEYVEYGYGWMSADFPWANAFFASVVSDAGDNIPEVYGVMYQSLSMGSMYMVGLILWVLLGFVFGLMYCSTPRSYPFFTVMYHFGIFGLMTCSAATIQGTILNPLTSYSMNSLLYLIGVVIYCLLFGHILYCIYNSGTNFYLLRIYIKATILTYAHNIPLYLFTLTILIDAILILIDYQYIVVRYGKIQSPGIWIYNNVACDVCLVLLVLVPGTILGIVLCSVGMVTVVGLEVYGHADEWRLKRKVDDRSSEKREHVWDIQFNQEKKEMEGGTEGTQTKTSGFTEGKKNEYQVRRRRKRTHKARQLRLESQSQENIFSDL